MSQLQERLLGPVDDDGPLRSLRGNSDVSTTVAVEEEDQKHQQHHKHQQLLKPAPHPPERRRRCSRRCVRSVIHLLQLTAWFGLTIFGIAQHKVGVAASCAPGCSIDSQSGKEDEGVLTRRRRAASASSFGFRCPLRRASPRTRRDPLACSLAALMTMAITMTMFSGTSLLRRLLTDCLPAHRGGPDQQRDVLHSASGCDGHWRCALLGAHLARHQASRLARRLHHRGHRGHGVIAAAVRRHLVQEVSTTTLFATTNRKHKACRVVQLCEWQERTAWLPCR
jgi:hypothetical protein